MKRTSLVVSSVAIGIVLVGIILFANFFNAQKYHREISIGDQRIKVALAQSVSEQATGLAGVTSLSWKQGMLFVFQDSQKRIFWMKGMRIPIDIIWLSGNTVVGIEKNVPTPKNGIVDALLPRYPSPVSVDKVLEVRAGFSDRFGIVPGARLSDSIIPFL